MELVSEWIDYDSPTGAVSAYLTRPKATDGPLPGVVVIQEILGRRSTHLRRCRPLRERRVCRRRARPLLGRRRAAARARTRAR